VLKNKGAWAESQVEETKAPPLQDEAETTQSRAEVRLEPWAVTAIPRVMDP